MKELTYNHCQTFKLSELGNNFFCYFKGHPKTPVIFIILDHQKEYKFKMISTIEQLKQSIDIMPIIVTDVKDGKVREKMAKLTEGRMMYFARSG